MKSITLIGCLFIVFVSLSIASAHEKVVVVPLGGSKNSQVNNLVGSWGTIGGADNTGIITFLDTSNFTMVQDGTPDAAGQDGMEIGTYTWDSSTGAFTVNVIIDTNGEWGLSHPQGAATISVAGNTLTYTDPTGTSILQRIGNILIGSWGVVGGADNTGIITFLDATNYTMVQDGTPDAAGQDGMEIGTYTWDSSTGAFTVSVTIDTNGEWGLSHPQGAATISVTGNTLTYTDPTGSTVMQRVSPIIY